MNLQPKKPYMYAAVAFFIAVCLCVLFFFIIYRNDEFNDILHNLFIIMSPFIYGAVIAYLLKPIVATFERAFLSVLPEKLKKNSVGLAIFSSYLLCIAIIYTVFALIIPELYESISNLINIVPARTTEFINWLQQIFANDPVLLGYITDGYSAISTWADTFLNDTIMPQLTSIVSGIGIGVLNAVGTILNFFVGLFVATYLLASRRRFARQGELLIYSVLKKKWADLLMYELNYADKKFGGFINGKLLDSFIIGIICYTVCVIFRFPSPILLSIIIGVTNIIPFFGPFIGGIPATLFVLINDPIQAIWFGIFVLALQQLDGNVIGPKILGDSTGISSFWVLFSIIFFGGIWGFTGMIVGVPLFAVLYDIFRQLITISLKRRGLDDMLSEYHEDFPPPAPKTPKFKFTKKTKTTNTTK